jgi:hypothetical protein
MRSQISPGAWYRRTQQYVPSASRDMRNLLDMGLQTSRTRKFAAGVAPDSSTPQIPALALL